jgi:hypothetical protein
VRNGNTRYVFWDGGKSGEGLDSEKREAVKYWEKQIRTLLFAPFLRQIGARAMSRLEFDLSAAPT